MNHDNGLTEITLGTTTVTDQVPQPESGADFKTLLQQYEIKQAHILGYYHHTLDFAAWDGDQFISSRIDPDADFRFLQSMRIFNEQQELYLWSDTPNRFSCRFRHDAAGEDTRVVEVCQFLKPVQLPYLTNQPEDLRLKVRNYIGYTDAGQAGYIDIRLCGYTDPECNILPVTIDSTGIREVA